MNDSQVKTSTMTDSNHALDNLKNIDGRVAIVGSMNADYTVRTERLPLPGETINGSQLDILPGGKSSNQAASAALLGAQVGMFGALGNDYNGEFLESKLRGAGVDTSHIARVDGPSGTTVITVSESDGENTIVYSAGANHKVTSDYVREHASDLTSYTVLGLCLESPMDAVIEAARTAHRAGMTVLLNDSPFMANLPTELVENVDVLLANEHEIAQIAHLDPDTDWLHADWGQVAQALSNLGFTRVIVTLGSVGSVVLDNGEVSHIDAVRVSAVDTTGCGDSYMGTVLAGLASGFTLDDSARMAAFVSAYAACGYGAQASYGTAQQVGDFFA
ncbi:ribokinase [Alloscardovia venturai]|uniref:Ribokinase n=1 Tax=Alloscardovia venturai TaxID=1769421 RepID=A0ABW2Y4Y3_9BIFI